MLASDFDKLPTAFPSTDNFIIDNVIISIEALRADCKPELAARFAIDSARAIGSPAFPVGCLAFQLHDGIAGESGQQVVVGDDRHGLAAGGQGAAPRGHLAHAAAVAAASVTRCF